MTAVGERTGFDDARAALLELADSTQATESVPLESADGSADAGVGLRSTAEKLEPGFVSLGHQQVEVRANPDWVEKPGVQELEVALASAPARYEVQPGVRWDE